MLFGNKDFISQQTCFNRNILKNNSYTVLDSFLHKYYMVVRVEGGLLTWLDMRLARQG